MVADLLYQTDSYLKVFDAAVVAVHPQEAAIALGRTAFYPGGGGQPHDLGSLRTAEGTLDVTAVGRREEQIWHWVKGTPPIIGTRVTGYLDWERRYQLMRTHSALHVLCGVVWRDYHALVTGGNMEPLKGRMDFEFETLRQELVREIEERVNAEVSQERDIRVKILPRAEAFRIPDLIRTKINLLPEGIREVRTVEIVGLDLQADGGTHVANTREIGYIRVAGYQSKGRINKRLYIELAI